MAVRFDRGEIAHLRASHSRAVLRGAVKLPAATVEIRATFEHASLDRCIFLFGRTTSITKSSASSSRNLAKNDHIT